MSDTTTELEVLNQIVDVLGGSTGQYETVVPVLKQIKELMTSGLVFSYALQLSGCIWEVPRFITDSTNTGNVLEELGVNSIPRSPKSLSVSDGLVRDNRTRLVWVTGATLDSGLLMYSANLQTGAITLFANGLTSQCSGVAGVDDDWTITSL